MKWDEEASRSSALFVSPHLDDVAFSCGGTLIALHRANQPVFLCTVFTASKLPPTSFGLTCQTEKGIAPSVDYMELRRREEIAYSKLVGIRIPIWLNFVEAPNRGYGSPRELFGLICPEDSATADLIAAQLLNIIGDESVTRVYAPAANGGHVDHWLVRKAVGGALAALPNPPSATLLRRAAICHTRKRPQLGSRARLEGDSRRHLTCFGTQT